MRLYEVNLKEPKIKIASDSIPVIFSDMSGNAFLFLNLNENELYCVTRETTNHSYAATTIYKLSFPPSDIIVNEVSSPPKRSWFRILLIILAIVATGYILYIFRFHRHKIRTIHQRIAGVEKFERNKRNAIWLLNEFKVFDKNGRDISYRFATKVRHAFLILFFENYFNDGIVSSDFSNILWPMLDKDQQKNNRGVIMNNLRKIFEDISEIALVKETMKWKVIFGPGVYIDFLEIHKALLSDRNDENNETILNYLSLGSLLPAESWEYLDRYKDRYSAAAIEILLDLARDAFHHHNFMKAIEISDIVLNYFDFLSETALVYKIKSLFILKNSAKAVTEYNKFRLKYNESISKNFQNSLDDILNMTLPTENY
jgi:hypothetical protein